MSRNHGFTARLMHCTLCGQWRQVQYCDFHKGDECKRCRFSPRHKSKFPILPAAERRQINDATQSVVAGSLQMLAARILETGDRGIEWLQPTVHDQLPDYRLLMTKAAVSDLERLPDKTREAVESEVMTSGWRFSMGLAQDVDATLDIHALFESGYYVLFQGDKEAQSVLVLRIVNFGGLDFDDLDSDDLDCEDL